MHFRKDAIKKMINTARTARSAHDFLKDPPLPGQADLRRWYPEQHAAHPPHLVPTRPPSAMTSSSSSSPRAPPPPAAFANTNNKRGGEHHARPASARASLETPGASIAFAAGPDDGNEDVAFGGNHKGGGAPGGASSRNDARAERSVLAHWLSTFSAEEEAFASKAVFVEMRLRQALACSAMLNTPNTFRCAIVCDAWDRVAPLTGRLEGVLSLLWNELLRCLYADYSDGLAGSGAKAYAGKTPYFVEAQRLRLQHANQQDTLKLWQEQRGREMSVLAERNKSINHTLSAWNRALGYVSGSKSATVIGEQLYTLASNLTEANNEADRISKAAVTDPVTRVTEMFFQLGQMDQEKLLGQNLLASNAARNLMKDAGSAVASNYLQQLTRQMSEVHLAEALQPLVVALPSDEKLELVGDILAGLPPTDSGNAFGRACAKLGQDARAAMTSSFSQQLDPKALDEIRVQFGGKPVAKKGGGRPLPGAAAAGEAASGEEGGGDAPPDAAGAARKAELLQKQLDEEIARNRERETKLTDELSELRQKAAEFEARVKSLTQQVKELQAPSRR